MRSLQWLIERLHQSFFFYLLPRVDRFVSIAVYYPSLGCLLAALALRAFALFCVRYQSTCPAPSSDAKPSPAPEAAAATTTTSSDSATAATESESAPSSQPDDAVGEATATDSTVPAAAQQEPQSAVASQPIVPTVRSAMPQLFGELLEVAPVCVLAVLVAAVCGAAPDFLVASSAATRLPQANTLLAGLATLYFFALLSPLFYRCTCTP